MSTSHFLVLISILLSALIWAYNVFQNHFNDSDLYQQKISILEESLEKEKLHTRLALENMTIFRQEVGQIVASLLEKKGQGEKGYPLRQLASVTSHSDRDKMREHISNVLFERAKNKFLSGNYAGSNELFAKIISDYSFSVGVVESFFLLAEGMFQVGNLEESVKTIERMVELFPGNELTGFALIRLGKIFEIQKRPEEALEVYRTVLRSFSQPQVAAQASRSMRSVDL